MWKRVFRLKFVLVPLAITTYSYPNSLTYREVFVFGIRIIVWSV